MDWEALWAESWIPAVYLIIKRSVCPLFNGGLFLLISDLDNHAGVNVFPNQLPGFCDVNGNLWNKVKINSQLHFLMKPNLLLLYSCILCPISERKKSQKPCVFVPESSVVSLQHLEWRFSAWTWKNFMIYVIICFPTLCTTGTVSFHTSCCSVWLLLRLQRFQVDLQEFLHPAAEMLPMPPHCLHANRYKWARSTGWGLWGPTVGLLAITGLLSLCKLALVTRLFDKGCDATGKMILLYTVYTKPRWWAGVWVCLFFRPYPELPYLQRPSLCRLSFSSSFSLSGQTWSWPFCRHGGPVLLSQRMTVNTPTQNDLTAAPPQKKQIDEGDNIWSLSNYNV